MTAHYASVEGASSYFSWKGTATKFVGVSIRRFFTPTSTSQKLSRSLSFLPVFEPCDTGIAFVACNLASTIPRKRAYDFHSARITLSLGNKGGRPQITDD